MKPSALFLAAALLGQSAFAQSPAEDILIYKFTRTLSWQQHEASPDRNGVVKGRNLLAGNWRQNSYWIFDRGNNKFTEVYFFTDSWRDNVPQKLYTVDEAEFALLGTDPAEYVDDKWMDVMFLPTAKAGVEMQTCRDSYEFDFGEGYVWDLTGPTKPHPVFGNVANLLSGFYQESQRDREDALDGSLISFYSKVFAGKQSATFDTRLTTLARTVSANGNTPNTMENAIETVILVLEKLGYDYSE